jgi:hypothetical protein
MPTKKSKTPTSPSKSKKTTRAPSAYNIYMRDHLKKVKAAHPHLTHKEAFSQVAKDWKASAASRK